MSHPAQHYATYERILEILSIRTQAELGEILGISQGSVSSALDRACIPDSWLMTILRTRGINPLWVETGRGEPYVVTSERAPADTDLSSVPVRILLGEILRRLPADNPQRGIQ